MKIKFFLSVLLISTFAQAQAVDETTSTTSVSPQSSDVKTGVVMKDDPDFFSKSSFGILFYSLGGYDDSQFKSADPSFALFDSYVAFSWKLPKDVRVSILPTFGYTTSGYDNLGNQTTDKFYWRDFSFAVAQNRVLEDYLPAAWDLKQKARLYLPTSDGSKAEGMIARLRLELEARYNLDRYSNIRMYAKPSYYFQRSKSYLSGTSLRTSKMIDSEHGSEVNWSLNKYFSIKPGFEIQEKWSNKSDANASDLSYYDSRRGVGVNNNGTHMAEIGYRLGFEIKPNRDMNFTVGIQEVHDLIDPSVQPRVGYTLLTNITIL